MIDNVQLVLFAIQAGVRLYAAGRKSYVEATLDRPLTLPLPTGPSINVAAAANFFINTEPGRVIVAREENERIRHLLTAEETHSLSPEGQQELTQIYVAYLRELNPDLFEGPKSPDEPKGWELVAIMTVRQWSKGELGDHPNALQSIAGTLVNIAVDYFIQMPGAISDKRPAGRALKAFLKAIDDLDFADTPPAEIAGDLLVAVVDSVGTHPDLIGNTETEKKLVQNIAKSLALSAKTHLGKDIPTEDKWRGSAWLQMIARAVVKGGVDTVLADPKTVLGVRDAEAKFIQEVGGTIAELVIGPEKLKFQELLSGEGVNTIIKAALGAAAKNPDILRIGNQGLRNIIAGVAEGLSNQPNLLTNDIFPELARLVLEKSANNLELVWPDGSSDPAKHLLITGTRELFLALAEGTYDEGWPTLTKAQLIAISKVVFDEIVDNPDWLLKRAGLGNDTALSVAVRAALDSLRQYKGLSLSADAAAAAISAAVSASAMRLELLRKLPPGGVDAGKVAIRAAMDAIFASAFGDDVTAERKWMRARNSTLLSVLEVALNKLAKIGAEQKHINVLRRAIGGLIDERLTVEQLGEQLEQLLKAA
jgi:hypothetical protein